jgi:hypothetical protein
MPPRDEPDPFEEAFLHGYPNPDRIGCPGSDVLRALARRELPIDHPARLHLGECSPCFREFKQFQRGYEREKSRPLWSSIAAGILASKVPIFTLISAAIAFAAIFVAGYLGTENRRLHTQLGTLQSENTNLTRQIASLPHIPAQPREPKQIETGTAIFSAQLPIISRVLEPRDLTRGHDGGTETTILPIPPGPPSLVVLLLRLQQDNYSEYSVVLQTPDVQRVSQIQGLKSVAIRNGTEALAVTFPSRLFKSGTYVIMLRGRNDHQEMEIIDGYKFRVIK